MQTNNKHDEVPVMPLTKEEERRIIEKIAKHVSCARDAAGMSRRKLSEQIGYSESSIQRLEKGRVSSINFMMVYNIARVFDMTYDELLGQENSSADEFTRFLRYLPYIPPQLLASILVNIGLDTNIENRMDYIKIQFNQGYKHTPEWVQNFIKIVEQLDRDENYWFQLEKDKKFPEAVQANITPDVFWADFYNFNNGCYEFQKELSRIKKEA